MRGARFRASVPIRQEMVDGWLRESGIGVEILPENRVSISYKSVRVRAEIVGVTPDLAVALSTPWWSRAALWGVLTWKPGLQSYVQQREKLVYVMCGRIPAVARWRELWRHVSEVRARTAPGRLVVDLQAVVS